LTFIDKPNKHDFTKDKWYGENMIDNVFETLMDFFGTALNNNIKIIQFNIVSKLGFKLNEEDWNFLNTGSDFEAPLNEKFPKNIEFLKSKLSKDLFILDSLEGIAFLILLPKEKDDVFYYDLILGFDNSYNFNEIANLKLNLVNINGSHEWSKINIDEIKLRQLFNFSKIKFNDYRITNREGNIYHIDMRRLNREQYKIITFRKLCNHFYCYLWCLDEFHAELASYFMSCYWLFGCIYSCFIPYEIQKEMHKKLGIKHILDDLEEVENKKRLQKIDKDKK
jgi:hypothetical protein